MSELRVVLGFGWILATTARALPCGHDGPDPFLSVIATPVVKPVAQYLPEASEMVLLNNKIAYRDTNGWIQVLDKGTSQQQTLGKSAGPLFPVVDPGYLFLISQSPLTLLDTVTSQRWRLPEAGVLQSADWSAADLMLISRIAGSALNRWVVLRRAPSGSVVNECSRTLPSAWEWVEGSRYPLGQFIESKGNRFRIHEMDLKGCSLMGTTSWTETIPGTVRNTRYFPGQDAYATLFDFPHTHVRWQTPYSCGYYKTTRQNAQFISSHSPMVASWDGEMHLFGLHRGRTFKVPSQISPVSNPRLFEVDEHGMMHILAPSDEGHTLFDLDVSALL